MRGGGQGSDETGIGEEVGAEESRAEQWRIVEER